MEFRPNSQGWNSRESNPPARYDGLQIETGSWAMVSSEPATDNILNWRRCLPRRIEERQSRDLHIRLQPDRLNRDFHLQLRPQF